MNWFFKAITWLYVQNEENTTEVVAWKDKKTNTHETIVFALYINVQSNSNCKL